jgi:hypothetical protein
LHWSYTLREELGLRVFKGRVLRNMFGSERGEVTGEWISICREELMNYIPQQIIFV